MTTVDDEVKARINERYLKYAVLSDYFPLTLQNGAVVDGVTALCSHCQGRLLHGVVRGEVRMAPENIFRVTAIGWCIECKVLSPYLFHIVPMGDTYDFRYMEQRGWIERCETKSVIPFPVKDLQEMLVAGANTN